MTATKKERQLKKTWVKGEEEPTKNLERLIPTKLIFYWDVMNQIKQTINFRITIQLLCNCLAMPPNGYLCKLYTRLGHCIPRGHTVT